MNNITAFKQTANELIPPGMLPPTENKTRNLIDYLNVIADHKWLVLFTTLVTLLLGTLFAYTSEPTYRANALLQAEKQVGLANLLQNMGGPRDAAAPVLADVHILHSRMVLGEAVDALHLDILNQPVHYPVIGRALASIYQSVNSGVSSAWFGAQRYAWGGERIKITTLVLPKRLIGQPLTLVAGDKGTYKLFDARWQLLIEGTVGSNEQTNHSGDPHTQIFVSTLKARPGTHFRVTRISKFKAIAGLNQNFNVNEKGKQTGILELSITGKDRDLVEASLEQIVNIYVRQNVERKSVEAAKSLEFLETQLPEQKQQMEIAVSELNNYRQQQGSVDLASETRGVLGVITQVQAKKKELQRQRELLRTKFTASHPNIKALDAQIHLLNREISEHNKKVSSLPKTQQSILRLTERVQVTSKRYNQFLNKAQELRMAKAGTVGNVRIVDQSHAPEKPIAPNKGNLIFISLLIGFGLGTGLALFRQSRTSGIEDPDVVEQHLGIPIYATIPHSSAQAQQSKTSWLNIGKQHDAEHELLAYAKPNDLAIESIRSLRTTLHFAQIKADNNIVLISGPSPATGKSFVSANLAAALVTEGKKVLLIDGDMRKGYLHQYFDMPRGVGLSDYISGRLQLKEVIHKTKHAGIYFIPTGEIPPNPAELLLHERFADALTRFTELFDHIIIDSPPILAVTDAAIIGRMAGAAMMVVKAGAHQVRELEQSVKRMQQAGVNLRGIVFNGVDASSSRQSFNKYVYQYTYEQTDTESLPANTGKASEAA